MGAGVWLVTGAQASGKSTVADLLAGRFERGVHARPLHLVVLRPAVAVVEQRDQDRRQRLGKVAYRGGFTPAINDGHVATTRSDLGLWLDTSAQTARQTVDEVLARVGEARVG